MLTEEARRERKWGSFPALRQALESKTLPAQYRPLTSTSDTFFDAILRIFDIADLVQAYADDVQRASIVTGTDEMCRDLDRVMQELNGMAYRFTALSEDVSKVLNDVRRSRAPRQTPDIAPLP